MLTMLNSLVINYSVAHSLMLASQVPFPYLLPLCAAPAVTFVLLTPWLTETPTWLARNGRMQEAKEAIQW